LSAATLAASSAGPGAGKLVAGFSYSASCCCAWATPAADPEALALPATLALADELAVLPANAAELDDPELELPQAASAASATAPDAAATAARPR
jgi:hypothetical protein